MRRLLAVMLAVIVVGCDGAEQARPLPCIPGQPCIVGLPPGHAMAQLGPLAAIGAAVIVPTADEVQAYAADARYMELDAPVTLIEPEVPVETVRLDQWHLAHIDVGDAWHDTHGEGTVVAVVDTGADCTHPALHCWQGANFVDDRPCGPGANCDGHGHGTHVAGIVAAQGDKVTGVAPETNVRPVKALSDSGGGSMSAVASGIIWAAQHGAHVINLSLGSPNPSRAVWDAVIYARDRGSLVVAARGNAQSDAALYPACYADVAVTATDQYDQRTSWSSFGNCGERLLVGAPGQDIVSTVPGGNYAAMSGTSMAGPVVSGIAAMLVAIGTDGVEGLRDGLVAIGNPAGEEGVVNAGRSIGPPTGPTPTPRPSPTFWPTEPYPGPTVEPTVAPTDTPPACKLVKRRVLTFWPSLQLETLWLYECEE